MAMMMPTLETITMTPLILIERLLNDALYDPTLLYHSIVTSVLDSTRKKDDAYDSAMKHEEVRLVKCTRSERDREAEKEETKSIKYITFIGASNFPIQFPSLGPLTHKRCTKFM